MEADTGWFQFLIGMVLILGYHGNRVDCQHLFVSIPYRYGTDTMKLVKKAVKKQLSFQFLIGMVLILEKS